MRILFPDARIPGDPDVERAVAGPDVTFDIHKATRVEAVPEESWASCDAIVVYNNIDLTDAAAAMARRCRLVVRAGVGYDRIDVAAFGRRGIPVCNTPDYGTTDVADMAMALLLALARGVVTFDRALRDDLAASWRPDLGPAMRRLRGSDCGIVGLGRIGTAVGLRAQAFGMRIAFYDPYLPNGTELALGFDRAPTLHALLGRSDVISLHAPLTEETRGMIGGAEIAAMRRGALLVNTARGPICRLDAIYEGLRSGQLAAAGLDVLPQEPPDAADPLIAAWLADEPWIKGRLLLAPHAAFYSADAQRDMRRLSMETVLASLRDGRLRNCVNASWLASGA